jgi:hypothetical protein
MYFIYKMKLPKIVNNKYVLYLVLVLAIINAVGLLQEQDYDSLLLLTIVGLLSSYFTKNMVVVLGIAMTVANYNYIQDNLSMLEGFKGGKGKGKSDAEKCWKSDGSEWVHQKQHKKEGDCPEPMCWASEGNKNSCGPARKKQGFGQRNVPKSKSASVNSDDDETDEARVDYAATLEGAYENLQNMLGDEGMKGLTNETKNLVKQQKGLMESLSTMTPVLKSAKKTLDDLDLGSATGDMQKIMAQLGGKKKSNK